MNHNRTMPSLRNQRGAGILAVIIGALIIGGALLWAFGGGGASSNLQSAGTNVAMARASGIISQGNELNDGFQKMMAMGNIAGNLTFNTTGANGSTYPGIFNTTDNLTMTQKADSNSLDTGAAGGVNAFMGVTTNVDWIYPVTTANITAHVAGTKGVPDTSGTADTTAAATPIIKLPGVGVAANADYLIALPGVSQAVCQQINSRQHGTTVIPQDTANAASVWTGGAANSAVTGSWATTYSGWTSGCVETSDGFYIYFQVVAPQ